MTDQHFDPTVRHEIVLLFDVRDGNPNGDPDAANQPRLDPETGQGLVTDVCIKRKIRNYVDAKCGDSATTKIFVQAGVALNSQLQRAYTALGLEASKGKGKTNRQDSERQAQTWMCQNFYDVRMFGAVMSTGDSGAGKVQGPAQLTFARSIDRIVPTEHGITRVAPTREGDDKETEMGSKWTVPYGLYRMHGFFSAHLAEKTGVSTDDLALLYEAVQSMFDLDRSAARGEMAVRGLHVFSHSSKLGDMPGHRVLDSVRVQRTTDDEPRSFDAYDVTIAHDTLAASVTHVALVA